MLCWSLCVVLLFGRVSLSKAITISPIFSLLSHLFFRLFACAVVCLGWVRSSLHRFFLSLWAFVAWFLRSCLLKSWIKCPRIFFRWLFSSRFSFHLPLRWCQLKYTSLLSDAKIKLLKNHFICLPFIAFDISLFHSSLLVLNIFTFFSFPFFLTLVFVFDRVGCRCCVRRFVWFCCLREVLKAKPSPFSPCFSALWVPTVYIDCFSLLFGRSWLDFYEVVEILD